MADAPQVDRGTAMNTPSIGSSAFPPEARLHVPAEFKACFESGQRLSSRYFRVHYRLAGAARLGLAVSRKVDRRAVVRNRIKRIARDSFRRSRGLLPAVELVLLAKREAAAALPAALAADLAALWRRLAALKPLTQEGTMRADAPTVESAPVDSLSPAPAVAPAPDASRSMPE
jgi:ribonuclease P protein component